jgi:hypothetical protein
VRKLALFTVLATLFAVIVLGHGVSASSVYIADGPSSGGISSDNVEYIRHIPISIDGVGGRVVGNYFYTNDQNKIMIFDVEDPLDPVLTDFYPLPQEWLFSREDLDTNGKILVMPNLGDFYVFDVSDKSDIKLLGRTGGGQHTQSCILNCKYAYGSSGAIHDLRNPKKPKLLKERWGDGMPASGGHDVDEVAPGLVLTATQPIMFLDVRKDPLHPKLLAVGSNEDGRFIHTGRWANNAKDKFLLMGGETNFRPRCGETNGAFMTWDASRWRKTHTFTMIDEYRMTNGTYADGKPTVNQAGCSSHWLEPSPKFKNGGIVAAAFFEHGTRFIDVTSTGKIKEIGWFVPFAGSTGAAYWVTDKIVYAVDYNRGIDILRFTGKQ